MDNETISFEVWHDPVVQTHGFSARSTYAEFCLATVVGPTVLLALRAVAARLEATNGPITVDLAEFGRSLGVGTGTSRPPPGWPHRRARSSLGAVRRARSGLARVHQPHRGTAELLDVIYRANAGGETESKAVD